VSRSAAVLPMLGSAVSSSMPTDFQRSTMGFWELPLMNCHAFTPGPTIGCPYCAVGMHSAVDSTIGLPRSPTSATVPAPSPFHERPRPDPTPPPLHPGSGTITLTVVTAHSQDYHPSAA
jgi:hypothetical protein